MGIRGVYTIDSTKFSIGSYIVLYSINGIFSRANIYRNMHFNLAAAANLQFKNRAQDGTWASGTNKSVASIVIIGV